MSRLVPVHEPEERDPAGSHFIKEAYPDPNCISGCSRNGNNNGGNIFCLLFPIQQLLILDSLLLKNEKEPYVRTREDPYFDGIKRNDAALLARAPTFDLMESISSQIIALSSSIIGDTEPKKLIPDISEKILEKPLKDSVTDTLLETSGRSLSGRWSKLETAISFTFPKIPSDLGINVDEANVLVKESISSASKLNGGCSSFSGLAKPTVERSYSVNKMKSDLSRIPLPQSAASFYNGNSPQLEILESCDSINRLNLYLKARRDDIVTGVPGRFLHTVIGQDVNDAGSVASTIMYAFYLNETLKSSQLCTVPIINMKRTDVSLHAEIKWLLDSCHIDLSSLIFVDEIDLSYYDIFGSLKLVLLNSSKLPTKQEAFKEALVEIFNCKKGDSVYPWVETVTMGEDCSCCTLIAEKFALISPEILAGQGFSRLLLAGILLDTGSLTNPRCTSKDKYMATLLINGAGRFGCNGLYQILRYKMHDVSELKVGDILLKDFKKWARVGNAASRSMMSQIGMSSIGISIKQLLAREDSSAEEIILFQQSQKLRLLMIVSGYYDSQKNFKREILVSAESVDLMKNLLHFLNSNASQLPLKVLHQPGLRDELRAFEIDNKITSRKTIESLLEEFGGTSRR
ncbi:hypothetical protein HHK36_001454 [Tetracentron sinense]|uniref:DHHA2 domain-containing protein n=1 Tax=Tetracentron sinense TaxID=13715 RepID=A0A835A3P7_TETSI|nr:hypothetical protein HHK36_001454 [Tetracentron sinense]